MAISTYEGYFLKHGKKGQSVILVGMAARGAQTNMHHRARLAGVEIKQDLVVVVGGPKSKPTADYGIKVTILSTGNRDAAKRTRKPKP